MESPESEMQEVLGRSDVVGATTDEGKGRIFPCESCGADFEFNIGQQKLKCPYCGFEKDVELTTDSEVVEQDFHAMLERIVEFRELDEEAKATEAEGVTGCSEVRCDSCSGVVVFSGTLTSTDCPYCGSPIQRENVHTATKRVPVDGVLPFLVERSTVQGKLKEWVKSRWFAPGDFKKRGAQGKFNGVYLPYWTFDSLTFNVYSGERGENYTVRVGTGKNKRTETRTRWYPASGRFQRFFDDVLVVASQGLPENYIIALEPWPLTQCVPFTQQYLAGYLARTYDIELDRGFENGKKRIDAEILSDVRGRIGGDKQRVHSVKSRYDAVTYKHLLLPVYLMTYRFKNKPYQIFVNAVTGEIQGQRPYSWVKILMAVLTGVAAVVAAVVIFNSAN
ncbi:MAG: hypothetical protein ACPIA2_16920 [Mariniblastus sp.]